MNTKIKRALSFILTLVITLSCVPYASFTVLAADTTVNGGYGSNEKFLAPIEAPVEGSTPISNRAELEAIANNLSGSYYLTTDIDLSEREWVPIGGTYEKPFSGIFDGQGHIVKGISIKGDVEFAGLFGNGEDIFIKNVGIEGGKIDVTSSNQYLYVGGIIGVSRRGGFSYGKSVISNCYNESDIFISTTAVMGVYSGGIAGVSDSKIISCYNRGNVSTNAVAPPPAQGAYYTFHAFAGGLVGEGHTLIENSYNSGNISTYASSGERPPLKIIVGGIFGHISLDAGVHINKCYNSGNITGFASSSDMAGSNAGGIGGLSSGNNGIISNCYNQGTITSSATSSESAGSIACGILGANDDRNKTISNCFNKGDLYSKSSANKSSDSYAGGIVSNNADNAKLQISDCVILSENIVGASSQSAIIGIANASKSNNLARNDIGGNAVNDADNLLPLADFYKQSTYEAIGWDFATVWEIPNSGGFPKFKSGSVINDNKPSNPETDKTALKSITIPYQNGGATTVQWGLNLFNSSSFNYSNQIALVAAVLSESAYNGDRNNGYYIENAYRQLGFSEENISLYSYPNHPKNRSQLQGMNDDVFAFSIAHQPISDGNLIVVVLRGTKGIPFSVDFLKDLSALSTINALGVNVHTGFNDFQQDIIAF
jgi:hypothetical protein